MEEKKRSTFSWRNKQTYPVKARRLILTKKEEVHNMLVIILTFFFCFFPPHLVKLVIQWTFTRSKRTRELIYPRYIANLDWIDVEKKLYWDFLLISIQFTRVYKKKVVLFFGCGIKKRRRKITAIENIHTKYIFSTTFPIHHISFNLTKSFFSTLFSLVHQKVTFYDTTHVPYVQDYMGKHIMWNITTKSNFYLFSLSRPPGGGTHFYLKKI